MRLKNVVESKFKTYGFLHELQKHFWHVNSGRLFCIYYHCHAHIELGIIILVVAPIIYTKVKRLKTRTL